MSKQELLNKNVAIKPTEEPKKFWQGTNFYVLLGLIVASFSSFFMEEDAQKVTLGVEAIFSLIFLGRHLIKQKGFSWKNFDKSANGWNYVAQFVTLFLGSNVAELIPALKGLVSAISLGEFPGIISAGLGLLTMVYYIFFQGKKGGEVKVELVTE
jgi:hypothetical protein